MISGRKEDGKERVATGESDAPVSSQRRRLIKGAAAAAPGIFTLYSGSAQAVASTYHCIAATGDAFNGDNVPLAGSGDGWARVARGRAFRVR